VGNGANNGSTSNARGSYNISIHQSFRLNGSNYYTIFDLPISVTNAIPAAPQSSDASSDANIGPFGANGARIACAALENPVLDYQSQLDSTHTPAVQPYLGGPVSIAGANQGGSGGHGSSQGEIGSAAAAARSPSMSMLALVVAVVGAVGCLAG